MSHFRPVATKVIVQLFELLLQIVINLTSYKSALQQAVFLDRVLQTWSGFPGQVVGQSSIFI